MIADAMGRSDIAQAINFDITLASGSTKYVSFQ